MKITENVALENQFKSFVSSRGGLYFRDHDLRNLQDAISSRMNSTRMNSLPAYYAFLTMSDKKEDEFRELLNLLTINHTYFFRNEAQFETLKEKVLPEIIQRKLKNVKEGEKPSIRIWSAGCSTGEEPYTMAIILKDVINDPENWDIHILATDASENALRQAKKGIYSQNSVKNVDNKHLEKYFTKHDSESQKSKLFTKYSKYEIKDEIKDMVTFTYFNLMDMEYPSGFDVIFCRNVVIYFELNTTIKVMNKFYSSLLNSGYFFIGYSETLQFIQDKFQMLTSGDAIYYQKGRRRKEAEDTFLSPLPPKEEVDIDKVLEDIARAEAVADIQSEIEKKEPTSLDIQDMLVQIIKAIHLKEYEKALALIGEATLVNDKSVDPHYLAAEIFVNQGKFDKAKRRIVRIQELNPLFAPSHYLLGFINLEESDFEAAKKSFKKALFLDSRFLLSHFYLAQVFKNEGNLKDAIRAYRNTLKDLSNSSPKDMIAYSGGINVMTLMSVCRDNIERLKIESY